MHINHYAELDGREEQDREAQWGRREEDRTLSEEEWERWRERMKMFWAE